MTNTIRFLRRLWPFLLPVFLWMSGVSFAAEKREPVLLTILHVNDFHGRMLPFIVKNVHETMPVSGAAYLSQLIKERRAGNPQGTILLSAGDMFQGSPLSNVFHGLPVIEAMNLMGFDAMAIGNHEFDWGQAALQRLRHAAAFPFFSANVGDSQGRLLEGVLPYTVVERKGLKVGVIGLTTTDTIYATKPDNVKGLNFKEPAAVLPQLVREVREKGAHLVIVLSHLGLNRDRQLAAEVSGIDVIVGGHSHTVVMDPVRVNRTIIVQAGYYGIYLGVLDLQVDPVTHLIIGYTKEKELVTVFAGPENRLDPKVDEVVQRYNSGLRETFAEVVGESRVDLVRSGDAESNIGNLVTDSMRAATGADIAFETSGGIRTDIPAGGITHEQVFSLLPFDNILITISMTGRQILEVLEQSATLENGILQTSGAKVVYRLGNPVGGRVAEVLVNGIPLDAEKSYRVTVNDFLAAGGDKYRAFTEGKAPVPGDLERDTFIAFIRRHSPVGQKTEGRIVFIP